MLTKLSGDHFARLMSSHYAIYLFFFAIYLKCIVSSICCISIKLERNKKEKIIDSVWQRGNNTQHPGLC